MPANKLPHRRVLLTQPSAAAEAAEAAPIGAPAGGGGGEDPNRPVRVVAYLTNEEAQQLEQVWLHMRMLGIRPSKADIVRAALVLALDTKEELGEKLRSQMAADAAGAPAGTARATAGATR